MRLYVGNISYQATQPGIQALFEQHGTVSAVKFVTDRETGQFRGFGFVDMPEDIEAQEAIKSLNGFEYEGRALKINEAEDRRGQGGGGGGGGGGYRGQQGGGQRDGGRRGGRR